MRPPQSRTDWVADRLRASILAGDYEPGEKLTLASLSDRWDVSATPLREALQRLQIEGLVELNSQRGARVAPVSKKDIEEVYELRLRLEPDAVRRSVACASDGWDAELAEALEGLEATLTGDGTDFSAFEPAHADFHQTLMANCGSDWVRRVVSMLASHSARYRSLSWTRRGGNAEVLEEHRRIFAAAAARDLDLVEELSRKHLEETVRSIQVPSSHTTQAAG